MLIQNYWFNSIVNFLPKSYQRVYFATSKVTPNSRKSQRNRPQHLEAVTCDLLTPNLDIHKILRSRHNFPAGNAYFLTT